MLAEIVQLNKVFKCNHYTYIRPKMHDDRLIYVLEQAVPKKMPKLATKLTKLAEGEAKPADKVENLLTFFHMDPALANTSIKTINHDLSSTKINFNDLLRQECMSFSTLSFMQQCIEVAQTTYQLTDEQIENVKVWMAKMFTAFSL